MRSTLHRITSTLDAGDRRRTAGAAPAPHRRDRTGPSHRRGDPARPACPKLGGATPGADRGGYARGVITFLLRALIFLISAAVGLIAADLILPGFHIDWSDWWGFLLAIVIFAVLQSVLTPWVMKMTRRHAPAFLGGIGIVSTFVALLVVVLIPGAGLGISDPLTWVLAPIIVWLITALATFFLPALFLKKKVADRRAA